MATTHARPAPPLTSLAAAAVGGAVGALARWVLTTLEPAPSGHFPWTVLLINVVGSALLAAVPLLPAARERAWLAVLLGTGVLGGFTTMSTASVDTVTLLEDGHVGTALAYVLGTLAAAVVAVALVNGVNRAASPGWRAAVQVEEGDR